MIDIKIDEEIVQKMLQDEVEKTVAKMSKGYVFWDTLEWKRRTCMSWNTMQEHFFHDPDFPKMKIGGKWYYPAEEVEKFLVEWFNRKRRKNYGKFIDGVRNKNTKNEIYLGKLKSYLMKCI